MADKAGEPKSLMEDLKKKIESLFKQIEKHGKKVGAKADDHLRMLRRQLKRKQRTHRVEIGKKKKADEKAGAKAGSAPAAS